jgi:hypothetical protein
MPKTCTFITLKIFKCSQLMIERRVVAMVVKLMPLSFRNGITQCSKSNLFNKDRNCITIGLLDCHVHFKQPHNNMYGHSSFIQNINNQSKSIHITMRHLKRKISKNNFYKCKIWQNMLVHYLFDHVKQHFFHKTKPRRKLNTKVSFEVKCSHKWTRLVTLANIQHQILQILLLNIIIFL